MINMITLGSREEWLEHRRHYIGGSDVASIVGLNPYKSSTELWEEKTGRTTPEDISAKPAIVYGTMSEPLMREQFKLDYPEHTVDYVEYNAWLNSDYPFASASLDGWITDTIGRKGIFECKTSTITSATQWAKWNGRIPDNYYCQVLFYLGCTGFDFVILKARLRTTYTTEVKAEERHYRIERADCESDIELIMTSTAEYFNNYIKEDKRPPLALNI